MNLEDRIRDALHAAARSADPSDDLADQGRREQRSPRSSESIRRVAVVVGALGVSVLTVVMLIAAFGNAAGPKVPTTSASLSSTGPAPAFDQLTMECLDSGASVDAADVTMSQDGVHLRLVSSSAASFVAVRRVGSVNGRFAFGVERQGEHDVTIHMKPATYEAACVAEENGRIAMADVRDEQYTARFAVIDPQEYWPHIQDQEHCGSPMPDPAPSVGVDQPLVAPPSGQMLVDGDSAPDYDDNVFAIAADGTKAYPVTRNGINRGGRWSPDGSRVVYSGDLFNDINGDSMKGGHTELYTAATDGTDVRQLTNDRSDADDFGASWSPDGRQVVFWSNRGGPVRLWIMNAGGSGLVEVPLPEATFENADSPAWSPDGEWIAFIGHEPRLPSTPCVDGELYLIRPDGSDLHQLTDDELYQQSPAWSPDGSRLAYMASEQSDYSWEIFTMAVDGSDVQRLTNSPAYDADPLWSPDGQLITFVSDRRPDGSAPSDDGGSPGPLAQYVMNADGSGVQVLFDARAVGLTDTDSVRATDWRN